LGSKVADEKRRLLKEAYDRVFSDEKIQKEQIDTSKWLEGLGAEGGQEW
jgi:hypothetical protein